MSALDDMFEGFVDLLTGREPRKRQQDYALVPPPQMTIDSEWVITTADGRVLRSSPTRRPNPTRGRRPRVRLNPNMRVQRQPRTRLLGNGQRIGWVDEIAAFDAGLVMRGQLDPEASHLGMGLGETPAWVPPYLRGRE